jgi:5-dehydro-2-deoxygluconokinase
MIGGYNKRLYILPFDHRHSYGSEVFGYQEPMTAAQRDDIAQSKAVIYSGFKAAIEAGVPRENAGLLVDEEFGTAILEEARDHGYITCLSTEKSGQHEFDFEYGDAFAAHIEKFNPTFAKVLVRYNPQGDADGNARQISRLKQLSDYLAASRRHFMFELLVPAEKSQLQRMGGDVHAYDLKLRPGLMKQAIEELQNAGVEPDVLKIEGLDRADDCRMIAASARRGGRNNVGCIILGRGENEAKVIEWLTTAAAVPGFIGFAVGRSSFLQTIIDLRAGKISRGQAVRQISDKFMQWVGVFDKAAT